MDKEKNQSDNIHKVMMDSNNINFITIGIYNNNIIMNASNENEINTFITDIIIYNINIINAVHINDGICPICVDKELRQLLISFIKNSIGIIDFNSKFFKIDTHNYVNKNSVHEIKIIDSCVYYSVKGVKDLNAIKYQVTTVEEMIMLRERIKNSFPYIKL